MQRDIRTSDLYREIESLCAKLRGPGSGRISDAAEVHVSPSGEHVAFAGTLLDQLEGATPTRVCLLNLASGDVRVVTFGPNSDRLPKYSPDGTRIAFLSDRRKPGDFQLHLLDVVTGISRSTPRVDGWVEYLHWSPDGKRILLGVAGHGADVAGPQGAVSSSRSADDLPSWMPAVEGAGESYRWRRAWLYDLAQDQAYPVAAPDLNVWEAVWCGNDALAAVASTAPSEGDWYDADLRIIFASTGETRSLYKPRDQLGWPAASPSGRHVVVVEAICSDRGLAAGDLCVIDTRSGSVHRADTGGVDITYTEWRSDRHVLLAGLSGLDTVVGIYDVESKTFARTYSGTDLSTAGRGVVVSGMGGPGDCAWVAEGFARAPEIGLICAGVYRPVKSFDARYGEWARALFELRRRSWVAPDGLEIQGWLLTPKGTAPHPLVMNIHGGPTWHWRPQWLGRNSSGITVLTLLRHGYAVLYPNPRGSTGRGQDFTRRVVGDMGGADTHDYLAGLDALISEGIADRKRLGVTGGSYGGYMTSWLITQDSRFAAAVPVAPMTNQVTQHLISNIPQFDVLFLADTYTNPHGKYFQRSPIMHAKKVNTPTLNICGALDRCTPPEEAVQFHNALLENGVESVLVIYPQEGHGVRKFPAVVDYAARVVSWFRQHMPSDFDRESRAL